MTLMYSESLCLGLIKSRVINSLAILSVFNYYTCSDLEIKHKTFIRNFHI